jgi:two-component system alkaline phosphatase synthesis response regulator PhoP/two-component system response regulator VicR
MEQKFETTLDLEQLCRPSERQTAVLERPRALIAEDERAIAKLIRLSLERLGYEVEVASDGIEALTLIRQNPPKLVLLDVMMPYIDGFEVLKRIRREYGDGLRIIMLTARTEDRDVFQGYRDGADAYLTKPFNPYELSLFVRRVMLG